MNDRIKKAAEEAQLKFWEEICKHFPEITTGDCDPLESIRFDMKCEEMVKWWVSWNSPTEEGL